jgi:hypothetical protein
MSNSQTKNMFLLANAADKKRVATMILEKVLVMNNRGASQIEAERVFEGTLAFRRAPSGDDIGHLRIRLEACRGSLRLSNCRSGSCGEQTKECKTITCDQHLASSNFVLATSKTTYGEQRKTQMWTHLERMGLHD